MNRLLIKGSIFFLALIFSSVIFANTVKVKDLTRLAGEKENALVGYGIIAGLAGTGDSSRSKATFQSIKNILQRFGVNVPVSSINSRNAAAVMVTASLPPFAQIGDKLDINITSMGDARNLVGGTLLMTHLTGANKQIYALAQGPISVGGFSYDFNGNLVQKNHPTAGYISGGAIVEREVSAALMDAQGDIAFKLHDASFSNASRIADAINEQMGLTLATASSASSVNVQVPEIYQSNLVKLITRIQDVELQLDVAARVVVNERTGTVVSGGNVKVSPVTITHGDLNVNIKSEFFASQPFLIGEAGENIRTETIQQSEIEVQEESPFSVSLPNNITVAELVAALNKVKATSRDIIVILQSIKRAGALHAELIVQ